MIYPTMYSFNAPYRGPKASKDIDKLFTSIIYDVSTVSTELASQSNKTYTNLKFCVNASVDPFTIFQTAGTIDGIDYNYRGIDTKKDEVVEESDLGLNQSLNNIEMKLDHILENL